MSLVYHYIVLLRIVVVGRDSQLKICYKLINHKVRPGGSYHVLMNSLDLVCYSRNEGRLSLFSQYLPYIFMSLSECSQLMLFRSHALSALRQWYVPMQNTSPSMVC